MGGDDVDFVVGPAGDEELPASPVRTTVLRRAVIVGVTAAVLGAIIGLRLATSSSHSVPIALPSSSSSPSSSAVRPVPAASQTGGTVLVVPMDPRGTGPINIPEPPAKSCPTDVTCTVRPTAPGAVAAALRDAFPGAVLHSAVTELANRPRSAGGQLLARAVVATAGDLRISVAIVKDGVDAAAAPVAELGVVGVDAHVPGYEVSVQVRSARGFARVLPRTVRALAVDSRLLVT